MMFTNKCCIIWYIFTAILNLRTIYGSYVINLSNETWILENNALNVSLNASVPGSVHTTLLNGNIIKDPYVGFRDIEYAWIADNEWTYKTTFEIKNNFSDHPYARVKFLGLDTVSTISFNNEFIGKSKNMFTKLTFPIHSLGKINTLVVVFQSPTEYAKKQFEAYDKQYGYKIPPVSSPSAQHGRDHPNFIRKEQCSFSWDWGPSFPTISIWKSVFLEVTTSIFLDEIIITPKYVNGQWYLLFEVAVDSFVKRDIEFSYGFKFNSYTTIDRKEKHSVGIGVQNVAFTQIVVEDSSIDRWWPTGYGEQPLYTGYVEVADGEGAIKSEAKFGFRTIELIKEPITGSDGLSFYFKINSKPIFLKGANWIPADSFQERVTELVLLDLLLSAKYANINTLRVWGGGIYEQDKFYQLADELGIMIWHDLMFAVALYPVDNDFLSNVAEEIRYQVRRLHNHPCIIAWSGNNENEAAIAQTWWDEVKTNKEQLISDYGKLYAETIKPIVISEDKTRPFILSSPSNGNENTTDHYIAKNPQDSHYGDVHFYDYLGDCWNPETFPNPRFASEYGYQSYPSFEALTNVVTSDDQLAWNSSLLFHRQHHKDGNFEIERFIRQHFELPFSGKSQKDYLEMMVFLSQIVQALCIKYESEHYRRLQENLINGEGHTMGALYWQLNDIWQAPSWSSIEYGGRWKILHFYVRKFFAPSIVSAYIHKNELIVNLVQDHLKDYEQSEQDKLLVNITLHSWKDFSVGWNETFLIDPSTIPKHSVEIYRKNMSDLPLTNFSFIKVKLTHPDFGDVISDTELFISNFSSQNIINPNLRFSVVSNPSVNALDVFIRCDSPAAFVYLESRIKEGRFSDNGFVMTTGYKVVTFYNYGDMILTPFDLQNSIKVISLYDVYRSS